MKKMLLMLLLSLTAVAEEQRYDDEGLGLRSQSVFTEEGVEPPVASFPATPPGVGRLLDRAYPGAPPQIPHATTGLLPITKKGNACISCHMPPVAAALKATEIPVSHKKGDQLSNARYNCSQCHVPQAEVKTLVKNRFAEAAQ